MATSLTKHGEGQSRGFALGVLEQISAQGGGRGARLAAHLLAQNAQPRTKPRAHPTAKGTKLEATPPPPHQQPKNH